MNQPAMQIVPFDAISPAMLYAVLALRQQVFCVEQDCPYQDADFQDQHAWHVLLTESGQSGSALLAYARILPPGTVYADEASIGRVVCDPAARGQGLGRAVMQAAIDFCRKNYPQAAISLSAQSYLHDFYRNLGFENTGRFYLEDNIPHQHMRWLPETGAGR